MAAFKPFAHTGKPIEDQFMSWNQMIKPSYNKDSVDAYTRTRVILMNGIETNAVITSHCMDRMLFNDEIKQALSMIRRADSQHQHTVDWMNPANQSILETTIGYEQVAVDLTANLAKNEEDLYFRQVLDFALLEDFDHLFRYACLLDIMESKDAGKIVQGKTDIKPGRPTEVEHRHPHDEMRKHFNKDTASAKTKMNYLTIVSGEQQTMNYYMTHGAQIADDMGRKLYAEIAEIEEQHVSQYEMVGDPNETPLEKMALVQLHEAYNYYSCALTEVDPRIKGIWEELLEHEITHVAIVNELLKKYENRDIVDILKTDVIEPLIVFEPNKDYVNHVLETQVDLQPSNMEFVKSENLPRDWESFGYRDKVNAGGVPSEDVVDRARRGERVEVRHMI